MCTEARETSGGKNVNEEKTREVRTAKRGMDALGKRS